MFKHKGKIGLFLLVIAIGCALAIPGLPGAMIASLFMIMALALYAIPDPARRVTGSGRSDPQATRIANTVLGIGLGLLGAFLLIFLPRQLSWLLIGLVSVITVVYVIMQFRRG